MDSYGYVETRGLVTAIEAADAALKAADVTLTNCYYVKGGIVTIEVMGDVAAVNAAVDAASESAKRLGNFLSSNVIARVASETKKILISDIGKKSDKKAAAVPSEQSRIPAEMYIGTHPHTDFLGAFFHKVCTHSHPENGYLP